MAGWGGGGDVGGAWCLCVDVSCRGGAGSVCLSSISDPIGTWECVALTPRRMQQKRQP